MSKVRKDKCSFKADSKYFFMKKDTWGTYWYLNQFRIFHIYSGTVCYRDKYSDMVMEFDKPIQDAYHNWLVETILLGGK